MIMHLTEKFKGAKTVSAVTGILVYLVVPIAMWDRTVLETREADVVPVAIPVRVVVINPDNDRNRSVGVHDVVKFIFGQFMVAKERGKATKSPITRPDSWRYNAFFQESVRRGRKWFVTETSKPPVRLLHSIWSNIYLPKTRFSQSGRPSIVHPIDTECQSFAFDNMHTKRFSGFVGPHIRSLVYPKLLARVLNDLASQESLPSGESSSQEEQTRGHFGPEKLSLLVGTAMSFAGLLLLFKVLDKVYLDPMFNVNMALCGFFLAAVLFWAGGALIFCALGLLA